MKLAAPLGLALALVGSQPAFAHAKLISAEPAINGVAKAAPQSLALTFNDPISGKLSGVTIKGADAKPIVANAMVAKSGKGLMVVLKAPLKPGAYTVDWHVVASDDGHKTSGTYKFTVK